MSVEKEPLRLICAMKSLKITNESLKNATFYISAFYKIEITFKTTAAAALAVEHLHCISAGFIWQTKKKTKYEIKPKSRIMWNYEFEIIFFHFSLLAYLNEI